MAGAQTVLSQWPGRPKLLTAVVVINKLWTTGKFLCLASSLAEWVNWFLEMQLVHPARGCECSTFSCGDPFLSDSEFLKETRKREGAGVSEGHLPIWFFNSTLK